MIIPCKNGEQVDAGRLSPEERHIIQKLLAWQSLAGSLAFFREKTAMALEAGWNSSGPVSPSKDLCLVIEALEQGLLKRLKAQTG